MFYWLFSAFFLSNGYQYVLGRKKVIALESEFLVRIFLNTCLCDRLLEGMRNAVLSRLVGL